MTTEPVTAARDQAGVERPLRESRVATKDTYLVVGVSPELRKRVERFRLRLGLENGNSDLPFTVVLRHLLDAGLDAVEADLKPLPAGFCGVTVNGEFIGVGEFL